MQLFEVINSWIGLIFQAGAIKPLQKKRELQDDIMKRFLLFPLRFFFFIFNFFNVLKNQPAPFGLRPNNTLLRFSNCLQCIRQSPILHAGDTPILTINFCGEQMRPNTMQFRHNNYLVRFRKTSWWSGLGKHHGLSLNKYGSYVS